jgi:hypothetical protein
VRLPFVATIKTSVTLLVVSENSSVRVQDNLSRITNKQYVVSSVNSSNASNHVFSKLKNIW